MVYMLAEHLGKFASEVMEMPSSEFTHWIAHLRNKKAGAYGKQSKN